MCRSKAEVGMEVPVPTSGVNGGPGAFPGSEISSVRVKSPEHKSYFFMRDRDFPVKVAGPENTVELKTFAEVNNRGIKIDEAGKSGGRNMHLHNWTKNKIVHVYPRLGNRLYRIKEY